MMRRREFLGLSIAVVGVSPLGAQPLLRRPRLGVLLYSRPDTDPNVQALRQAVRDLGYVDGRNIAIEYRYAEGKPERLPSLATELVESKPDVMFALGGDVAPQLNKASKGIPLVYAMSPDPVKTGLAASMAKPGGNATGVTFLQDELAAKRLEILKEAAPRISHVGFLWNPDHPDDELAVAERAAGPLGIKLHKMAMRGAGDLPRAFDDASRAGIDGIYVVSSRQTIDSIPAVIEFATKGRLPLAGGWGAWTQAGGLLSYGPNVTEMIRNAAGYIDKILKGAKPADLPVQQPTRFELQINLKTAKALGLDIPEAFLLRADKVIE